MYIPHPKPSPIPSPLVRCRGGAGGGGGRQKPPQYPSLQMPHLSVMRLSPPFSVPHVPQCPPGQISQHSLIKFTLCSLQIISPPHPFGNPQAPRLTFHTRPPHGRPPMPHPLRVSVQARASHLLQHTVPLLLRHPSQAQISHQLHLCSHMPSPAARARELQKHTPPPAHRAGGAPALWPSPLHTLMQTRSKKPLSLTKQSAQGS